MLQNITELYGHKLAASDGDIGHIKDFYFDDHTWVIRYLVADTGSWLSGRLVLLSPHAFGAFNRETKTLHVKLDRRRIENSPSPEAHKPVSRQYEVAYYRYYGWPAYWDGSAMWGIGGYPVVLPPTKDEMEAQAKFRHRDDKHLQSTHAVNGYHICAIDGAIGHVAGFLVDPSNWAIRDVVVKTGHWFSGREILIGTSDIERISYEDSTVYIRLMKASIQHTAENQVVHAGA